MATVVPVAFSPDGRYLAYTSPDGRLKIWEPTAGTLQQEYTPSSHLSATFTCLAWGPVRQTTCPVPKKKRRSSTGHGASDLDLIALGTTSGTILLYSIVKGELQTQLEEGHTDTVNSICWQSDRSMLYSCSADHHIIEWSLSSGKVKHKWKGDRGSITSVCLCHGRSLLSAGRSIKLWDLDTRQCLKSFTGHATEVFQLLFVPSNTPDVQNGASALESVENTYFLSAANGDKLINAWQIKSSKESKGKNAVASFALPDEPVHINISKPSKKDQPSLLAAVTRNGQLLIYEHVLNGKCKKPLRPKVSIQIATEKSQEDLPKPIQILAAHLTNESDPNVLFAHGSFLKPTFEKMPYSTLESDVCLVREDTSKSTIVTDSSFSKVKTPDTSQEVMVLSPGQMAPSGPVQEGAVASKVTKKKRKSLSQEMSMEERLNAISMGQPGDRKSATHPPTTDTLTHLLSQGLQSQDKKILNNTLQTTDETVIRNTVKRLPVPVIVPLVQELSRRMHGHPQSGLNSLKWIKTILTVHTSYLMTFPELVESLSSLYQLMDSRVTTFTRLARLVGKLDLILTQISSQDQEEEEVVNTQMPMLLYQDESSDEDEVEDMFAAPSEEEDWEDLSDMQEEMAENGDGSDKNESMEED